MEPRSKISNILVIGAGAMGSQIAMTAALAGYTTTVQDVKREQLDAASAELHRRTDKMVQSEKIGADHAERAHARLKFTTDLAAAASVADFVIEAATERLDIKTEIFTKLGQLTPAHAILATNSSTLGSSKIAEASGRPAQVCNMHFFNPALVMECVEVVRNSETSQETVDATMNLARNLSKKPVLINHEVPGFVANRLMGALQKEALSLFETGVASKEDIDATAKNALNHPMGPFALMDLVGLDVIDHISQATFAETKDPADAPNQAIAKLVKAGKLGRKTGEGWYKYKH